MIKEVIDLLRSDDWKEGGELIQTAKGKYQTPHGLKAWKRHIKFRIDGRR